MNGKFHRLCILIFFLVFTTGCNSQDKEAKKPLTDRQPAAAGHFYPADPAELRNTLRALFEKAKPKNTDNVIAIISPHAGYEFSGVVAASSFNQVDPDKDYDNIFIIGSSHHVSFSGASVYNQGDYVTPLGKVKVNTELADDLIKQSPLFSYHPDADTDEHCVEVQLPFLQYHLKKEFQIVPIVLGTQTPQTCKRIAETLKAYFNDRNLFIISTDFSHYPKDQDARNVDKETCNSIVSNSSAQLLKILQNHEDQNISNLATSLCGWTSVLTLLYITEDQKEYQYSPVFYQNSGDSRYADKSQVVGYWAIAISQKENGGSSPDLSLTTGEKKELLKIARNTINQYIREGKTPEINPKGFSKNLMTPGGAFVTLKEHGELRGCIGRFTSDEPLYKVIVEMAKASSTQDTRFEPVSAGEIDKLEIEISVLSPMKKIHSIDEIVLGKHGIYIKQGYLSGTFLPQVALETGWTKEEFLGHCSRDKAGIGWNGWKDADIYIYTAEVFSEKEISARKD